MSELDNLQNRREQEGVRSNFPMDEGRFQQEILRPILKAKHEQFIQFVKAYRPLKSLLCQDISESDKREKLKKWFSVNLGFRSQMIGLVVSKFDVSQTSFYLLNKEKVDRRIMDMLLTRLISVKDWEDNSSEIG